MADNTVTQQADGSYLFQSPHDFTCDSGAVLAGFQLRLAIYGSQTNPVILVNHAHSTSYHLAAQASNPQKGWWEDMVGPNKPIDTNRYCVICIGNLGSYVGCTNPTSLDPESQQPYRTDFPALTIHDITKTQIMALEALRVTTVHALIGNSMGGFIAQTLACLLGSKLSHLILVATAHKTYPCTQILHQIQRACITADPAWHNGAYTSSNFAGMRQARALGLLSYFNPCYLNTRFPNKEDLDSYINYNVEKFCKHFDANTYLSISNTMDTFDLGVYSALTNKHTNAYQHKYPLYPLHQIRCFHRHNSKRCLRTCKKPVVRAHYTMQPRPKGMMHSTVMLR